MVYICPRRETEGRAEKLKAEVLRVRGQEADAQVYESTRGIGIGDVVEQTGELLSVTLGPGLLGQVYDGLQNPLAELAIGYGTFLPRGVYAPALNLQKKWSFVPLAKIGDRLKAGDAIGTVAEGRFTHKIMIPFNEPTEVTLDWIQQGSFTVDTPIAHIKDQNGQERNLTLTQQWPVRRSLPQALLTKRYSERLYPQEPMITTNVLLILFSPLPVVELVAFPAPLVRGKPSCKA